jgi:putative ABC transport system permease protein
VVIINETLAKRYFPGVDPIGKRISPSISIGDEEDVMREIVAVVGDVKHRSLSIESRPEVYIPFAQIPFNSMGLVVRSTGDPANLIGAIREEVKQIDKNIPLFEVKTLERYVDDSLANARFNTLLIVIFASVALILTAVGLYGVMSYSVAQRAHEIGIRMALGAEARDVLRMVIGQGMKLAAVGAAAGLIGAYAVTRLASSLLYGVGATDPVTFAAIAVLLLAVAFIACWVPARRATKVDPMVALRYE